MVRRFYFWYEFLVWSPLNSNAHKIKMFLEIIILSYVYQVFCFTHWSEELMMGYLLHKINYFIFTDGKINALIVPLPGT
jgi:hypothetical protein